MSLGLHIKGGGFDMSLIAPIIASKPDIIVVVGGAKELDILRQIRAVLGDSCSYGFRAMDYEPWIIAVMGSADPVETAAGWLDDISVMVSPGETDPAKRLATLARDWGWVTWQGLNEESGYPQWRTAWDKARVDLAVQHKIKVGICGLGWGQPEPDFWQTYKPALVAAKAAGRDRAIVILHDYWPGADGPTQDDPYIFMRWHDLRDFCVANGLEQIVAEQLEFWEYGKDVPGWRLVSGLLPDKYVSTGSGSVVAYGILDDGFRDGMDQQAAAKLAAKAISSAMKRDNATGEGIDVIAITGAGLKRFSKQEVEALIEAR